MHEQCVQLFYYLLHKYIVLFGPHECIVCDNPSPSARGEKIHLTERLHKRTAASECNDVQNAHARQIMCGYDDWKYTLMMEVVFPVDDINSIQLR